MPRNTFLLFVFAAASISSVVESKSKSKSALDYSRIVGGNQARVGDYPYFVQMGGCGGALVAPDVVLFAAHCGNFENQQLSIGAYRTGFTDEGAQGRFCEEWIQDPLFNPYVIEYDFALCKLNKPVVINDNEVELAINFDDGFMTVGDPLLVMGLGTLEQGGAVPEYLQDVTVPYLSNEECNRDDLYAGEVTEIMFCAGIPVTGGKDSCQGDSGGPIVKRTIKSDGSILDTLVGVVSWGNGCGDKWPGIYARTSKRANWIQDTICNDFESVAPFCDNPSSESDIQCDDGEDLTVTITTDAWAAETSWSLTDSSGAEVMTRAYLYKNFENEHKLCLKSNECYEWTISDSFGDGQCTIDDDYLLVCGSYAFTLNGEEILSGSTFEDGYSTTETFCTGGAVVSPPEPPINIFCKDDNEVRFADGKGRKKSCKKYIKGRRKKMRKRCKSTVKGVVVSESCPKTCGEKAGVGRCVR